LPTLQSRSEIKKKLDFSQFMVDPYRYKNFEVTEEPAEDPDPSAADSIAGFKLQNPFASSTTRVLRFHVWQPLLYIASAKFCFMYLDRYNIPWNKKKGKEFG
jgi:hypothetical protein